VLKDKFQEVGNSTKIDCFLNFDLLSGRKKGRGGKRATPRQDPAQLDTPSDSPKRKDSKLEFQGRLSHASPRVTDSLITQFFLPENSDAKVSVTAAAVAAAAAKRSGSPQSTAPAHEEVAVEEVAVEEVAVEDVAAQEADTTEAAEPQASEVQNSKSNLPSKTDFLNIQLFDQYRRRCRVYKKITALILITRF